MKKRLLFLVVCMAGLVGAAEIHVAKSGNDMNPGTADAPLATIGKAAKIVNPGDVVKIGPGIYREQIVFKQPGTAEAPIVIEGTRGENGEYLTIVESNGIELKQWTPAPEVGANVWKTPLPQRPNLVMMDGDMVALINKRTMALPQWKELPQELNQDSFWGHFGPNCRRMPGFDLLRLPSDIWVSHQYFRGRKEQFWPTIGNVLTGWHEGNLYIRFANDSKPEEHLISVAYGMGFTLQNASYMTLRDLHMRGSRMQIIIKSGTNCIIEKCLLMHGGVRLHIGKDVKDTIVRDNVLTSGFITSELFGHRGASDMRGGLLYVIFKYVIGESSSDDDGIIDYGKNTKILNNIVMQGLIGISIYGIDAEIAGNVVRKMSSIGICTLETTVARFHHNLVMDCGIPLRIHHLRHKRARREEYHYCNLYVQPPNDGDQIFVHCESHRTPDDAVNFEPDPNPKAPKGAVVYKQNPPNPVDAGKIYIYHNTFWGGLENGIPSFDVNTYSRRFRMSMPFFVVNNIFKDSHRLQTKTHDLAGPNLIYVFKKETQLKDRRDPEVVKVNKVLSLEESQHIWNKNNLPGLPDMTLAPDSPALEAGVDISKPFTVNGKNYAALPGFKPGYFRGKAPAAGAFQLGEGQEHFIDLHNKAEEVIKMLKELRDRTAEEARRKATGK